MSTVWGGGVGKDRTPIPQPLSPHAEKGEPERGTVVRFRLYLPAQPRHLPPVPSIGYSAPSESMGRKIEMPKRSVRSILDPVSTHTLLISFCKLLS